MNSESAAILLMSLAAILFFMIVASIPLFMIYAALVDKTRVFGITMKCIAVEVLVGIGILVAATAYLVNLMASFLY